ncbi:MAG: hypothetical protein JSS82_07360 [Bacteroidetes bacterium]|nr:hypothetical protein [Bacteroidota bacterium]
MHTARIHYLAIILCMLLSASCSSQKTTTAKVFDETYPLPSGWYRAGASPYRFAMGTDKGAGMDGGNAATIKLVKKPNGFGTLMQSCKPDNYIGKRIRLTGYMRSKDVHSWAGFWLRVDDSSKHRSVAFDNMYNRPIRGTTDWTKYELVLDVPEGATNIAFGALLDNSGQIWFDKLNLEAVGNDVPITGRSLGRGTEPQNMGFDN